MMHNRRHSLWDLKTKDLEVEKNWVLNTPRRRVSVINASGFDHLSFGQYDEAGTHKLGHLDRPESDSEAEFTDSENDYSIVDDSESNDSGRLTPVFVFLKEELCPDPNNDLVDWESFSEGLKRFNSDFFTSQLVLVFKRVSPDKQPAPFSRFVEFFSEECDDPLIEFHRKQMYNSILDAFKERSPPSDHDQRSQSEEEYEEAIDFDNLSIDTLRKQCFEQHERIQELEVELESQRVENIHVNDRCRHLEQKITLLKDGERLHTHVILLRAMIRNGEDVKSKRLRIMPAGATVRICEIRNNRARIDFPIKGWCSVFAQDGRPILQSLNSESLRPSVKRGHEETRAKSESEMQRKEHEELVLRIQALEVALEEVALSKILLVQNTSQEIDRLSHLIVE